MSTSLGLCRKSVHGMMMPAGFQRLCMQRRIDDAGVEILEQIFTNECGDSTFG